MKYFVSMLALSCSLITASFGEDTKPIPKAKLMVLGTYHMSNPGLDLVKSKIKDTLSAERQKEILEVIQSLKRFNPTKIAIEAVDDATWNTAYQNYLEGKSQASADERVQLGFRLAQQLGLKKLYAVDCKLDMEFDKPMGFLAQKSPERLQQITTKIAQIGPLLEKIDQSYTVGQILALHNSDELIKLGQQFYMSLLVAHDAAQFPGADMLGDWYKRNLRIYSRLQDITEPGDRILVLFGSGHVKYLRDIIRDSDKMEFVSPLKYLSKVPASAKQLLPKE